MKKYRLRDKTLTVDELIELLSSYRQEAMIVVSLFRRDGTIIAYQVDGIDEDAGIVHIEISEEEGIIY